MASKLEVFGLAAAAAAIGTVYVLVHESRRKRKKAEKAAREAPISKEMLLKILNKSAEASKAVIERVRQTQIELPQIIPSPHRHTRHSLVPNASP